MEKRRGKDDEVPKRMWKAVETKIGKVRMAKAEEEREEERSRKEMGRERRKNSHNTVPCTEEGRKEKKRKKKIKVRKIAEEWEIWDKEEEVAKLETEARKLVPEKFYK